MGHEGPGCISDIQFEKHLEVVPQTRIHILQVHPSHQSLFNCYLGVLCQTLAVPWKVLSVQQGLLAPVYVFNSQYMKVHHEYHSLFDTNIKLKFICFFHVLLDVSYFQTPPSHE